MSEPKPTGQRLVGASLVAVATMLLVSAVAWIQLPAGATVPIHWNISGRPDGYAPKEIALLISPAIGLLLTLLFWAIPVIEPRRGHLLQSWGPYGVLWVGLFVVLLVVHAVTVLTALGSGIDVTQIILGTVGLLFSAIGLVLPRIHSNFLVGIRTPWTLTSERSWRQTHRRGGQLFVVMGLALAAVGLLRLDAPALVIVLIADCVALIGLITYSYVVWRSDPDRDTFGR